MTPKSLAGVCFLAVLSLGGVAWSRSSDIKQPCVTCHTMHNSQNGVVVPGNSTTKGALLNNSCYGCHSGVNAGDNSDPRCPKVLHLTANPPPAAPYMTTGTENGHNTLAGGDFFWVVQGDDLKGHNVNIPGVNQASRYPPGNSTKLFDSTNPLTCAGVNGCHGNLSSSSDIIAMYRTHHAVEQSQPMSGASLIQSYRWLDGVAGFEDPDYEFTVSSSDHNQYKGIDRTGDTDESLSISHLCAGCHGDFHAGAGNLGVWDGATSFGADPWIRHPVDYDMGLSGEFAGYGGAGVNAYNVATPVGSAVVTSVLSSVTGSGDTIIVCVSCHRAHGSPYDYSLRWDYKSWPGGATAYNGCGDCHTVKN